MSTKSEHALDHSEQAAILASAMDAIVAIDVDQRIVFFNAAAEKMFGCSGAEALGASVERFVPERYRAGHRAHIRRFRESGVTNRRMEALGEMWGLRTNGEEFPIKASIGTVATGARRLLSVILRDVSEKKLAESRQESQRTLSALLGNLPGMGYRRLNDDAWTMQFVSNGCEDLTGYNALDLIDGKVVYSDLVHPDDRQSIREAIEEAVAQGIHFNLIYRIRSRDGETRWVSERGIGVVDEHGASSSIEGIVIDVTGLKVAEHELRESEMKFRTLATNAAVAILIASKAGDVEHVNPYWCELAGLSPEDSHGAGWARALHPEERERLAREWVEQTSGELEVIPLSDRRLLRPDGVETWVHGVAVALTDSSGTVTGYLATLTDLTERRRAEEETRGRNRVLQELASGASLEVTLTTLVRNAEELFPDSRCSVLLLDHEKRRLIHGSSHRLPDFFIRAIDGLEIGDGAGSCGTAAHHRRRLVVEDVNTHATWIGIRELAAQAGIRACWSEPIQTPDGEFVGTFSMYHRKPCAPEIAEVEFISTTAHLAGVAIEHSRSDALLRDSEQRFRAVFNQRAEFANLVDPNGILTDTNQRSLDLLGATRSDVVGLPLWETPWWKHDPLLQDKLRRAVAKAAAGEFVRFEAEHLRADGAMTIIDFSLTPISDDSGAVQTLFAEGIDITDVKRAEESLSRSERRAHEAEKLASIATLTAGIAHDIGAPMTAILGYAEMMRDSLPDDKNRRRAEIIMEQLNRISELIRALLNVARPDDAVRVSLNLAHVIDKSLGLYREMMHKRGIVVERTLSVVPVVVGDPNRLQQVLLNLFVNASDAMRNGGTLRVSLSSGSDRVKIGVEDSGVGIEPEILERVFEPFFTTKERGRGTGLGLLVAKGIVDEHGGTIAVESSPGSGTTFTIYLPLSEG